MKIASFNVNSLRVRQTLVLQWLTTNQPDVLCVQETKVQDPDFPAAAFDPTGYKYAFKGQKTYNGVAIFSKSPLQNVSFGLDSEPRDEPRLIRADINGISIVNTYVPQGYMPESDKFEYKLNWFKRLRFYFENHFKSDQPVLWLGDLNVAPQAIDVYDPIKLEGHVCFNPLITQALTSVLDWGFVDVFRQHCQEPGQYTFWDYRMPNTFSRNRGWRLDHILATKPLAQKCTACYIDKNPRASSQPSDHTPIIAEFDW
jgi:exodeoxyribonuclease III